LRISQVCIDRPVLATVLSLVIALVGAVGLARLQNRFLPAIDPPVVSVVTVLPGAAAQVVETSVTNPLEDEVIGIEGVKHVTSASREGVSAISVEFELGRDLEAAASDVRDRVARVRSQLPDEAEESIVAKVDNDAHPDLWIALTGERYDQVALTTLAEKYLIDRLAKLPGVARIVVGGERRYSIRVWIDNRRLASHGLTIADVAAALRRENVDIPSGRLESADAEITVRSLGQLRTPESFGRLIVANVKGQAVRLGDVAEVEAGPEDTRKIVRVNGVNAVGLGVVRQSKANTLDVSDAVKALLPELRADLPPGVELSVPYDASGFIRQSIRDVTRTIFEASLLVVLVIYVFLRSFRATLVPAVAIPVSVLGSFAVLHALGFTLNTLTLMGVTLAIGLVVDDAIVVLENISRWVEAGTPRLEAARRGMQEISFAVVAATVSAVAVFAPLTFLTDETGRLFREFAVTVAAALSVSGVVALTLSPALCARLLRQGEAQGRTKRALGRWLEGLARAYAACLVPVLRRPLPAVGLGAAWLLLGALLLFAIDEELMAESDSSVLAVSARAPEGSSVEYMDRYQREAEHAVLAQPEVAAAFSVVATGFEGPGIANEGIIFVSLSDPGLRARSSAEVRDALQPLLGAIPGITAFAYTFSALFLSGGDATVPFVLVGDDLFELERVALEMKQRMTSQPGFENVNVGLYLTKPQLEVRIDRERASDLGISVRDVATTLQILLGGGKLSTFDLEGETYDVVAQLGRPERDDPRDLTELSVRGRGGDLISLSAIVDTRETASPREIPHYDRLRSVRVSASHAAGLSQGEGIARIRALAGELLPEGVSFRFVGEAEKLLESGDALVFAYGLALLVVYLVLAAQFESFVHPLTILAAVAFSFTGALIALGLTGATLNLFSKIGLVMLIGLVTKNSILIVEFANQLRARGLPLLEATSEAARTRFRPILMTALATMIGILPIALGRGAGGEGRAPLGIAVVGGVFFSALLTFLLVPATYLVIERARARLGARETGGSGAPAAPASLRP